MLKVELIRPVPQLLVEQAERWGDKIAFSDDRRSVGYRELAERTRRVAGHLAAAGVASGDRVLIYLDNSTDIAEAYLMTTRASLVGVCVNADAAPAEIEYMFADSGASVIVTDRAHAAHARQLAGVGGAVVLVVGSGRIDGAQSYEELAGTEPDRPPRDDLGLDEVAWMLYTSGTTGRPKGVLLTQRSCLWVVAACWAPIAGLSEEDRVLCPLPLFHSYALVLCVLGVFATGASEHIMTKFSPRRVLELVAAENFTILPGVPTMFQYLVHSARERTVRSGGLRLCVSAGAILPVALNSEFEQVFGVPLIEGYGITETSTMVTMNTVEGGRVLGSCGLPMPGVGVRLVDPATGDDVAVGEEGEVWVSGPNVMRGYHNRVEATAEVLRHGWYRTGDLGRRDPNGFLTISGRTKELIIRGGENIYPAEVEAVLLKSPQVRDAAVVARDHADLGEVPVAFVVAENPGTLDVEALLRECARELSGFKVPAEIVEVEAIPRTASGKIMRFLLREQLPAST
ncbi:class I adenylate-forming enzyme family protein [Amycolatopsis orientalis]|uniref:class I adenylate-forming enzyme family protein n=1 Tax=Amycolatopsis orientalis TaxID=31958 RepID=UPI00039C6E57|nr:AMP-binding protein [Amycolatopsis orientalis]